MCFTSHIAVNMNHIGVISKMRFDNSKCAKIVKHEMELLEIPVKVRCILQFCCDKDTKAAQAYKKKCALFMIKMYNSSMNEKCSKWPSNHEKS